MDAEDTVGEGCRPRVSPRRSPRNPARPRSAPGRGPPPSTRRAHMTRPCFPDEARGAGVPCRVAASAHRGARPLPLGVGGTLAASRTGQNCRNSPDGRLSCTSDRASMSEGALGESVAGRAVSAPEMRAPASARVPQMTLDKRRGIPPPAPHRHRGRRRAGRAVRRELFILLHPLASLGGGGPHRPPLACARRRAPRMPLAFEAAGRRGHHVGESMV